MLINISVKKNYRWLVHSNILAALKQTQAKINFLTDYAPVVVSNALFLHLHKH